ncbi:MAG: HypC/HybG/HupF family hydrogenase formation chaperone [Verrucomicrobia bacterium]|nr:HypC/HybG/HupF family hydrogenase formation chaperone [Verrucomicrobiota bacterium]MBU1908928.1 HypC/HybG/HupF family hydrogenase formation chaperone [Verrucomicrobiota bacterium]
MCLAIPARIIECHGENAVVEIGGVRRQANIAFIDDARPGDYLLLHAGFAIRKWSEEDVREYRALIEPLTAAEDK